jgi:hypothetical protein
VKRLQRAARRVRRIQGLLARGYRPLLLPLVRHRRLAWGFLAAIVVAFAGALLLPATQLVTANNSLEAPHTIRHFDMDNRVSPGGDGPPWRNYAIAAVAIIGLAALLNFFVGPSPVELSYTGLKQAVREGRVAQVTFEDDRIRGRFHAGKAPTAATGDDDTDETTATGADESRTGAEGDTRPGAAGGDPVDAETNRQTKAGNRADAAGEGSAAAGGAEAGAGARPALRQHQAARERPRAAGPAGAARGPSGCRACGTGTLGSAPIVVAALSPDPRTLPVHQLAHAAAHDGWQTRRSGWRHLRLRQIQGQAHPR